VAAKRDAVAVASVRAVIKNGCADAGVLSIVAIQPVHVATWIKAGTREFVAPSVKQRLAAIYTQNRRLWVRLREKGGKRHAMACHHNLEEYLTNVGKQCFLQNRGISRDYRIQRVALSPVIWLCLKPN
jgi:hypothetical protein